MRAGIPGWLWAVLAIGVIGIPLVRWWGQPSVGGVDHHREIAERIVQPEPPAAIARTEAPQAVPAERNMVPADGELVALPPGWTLRQPTRPKACPPDQHLESSVCVPNGFSLVRLDQSRCSTGQHFRDGACVEDVPQMVERGFFGCRDGYVDHPYDPEQCVLPVVAERYFERRARR